MATYIQRKNGWLAQIRRKGHDSICRTFNTKTEAERWVLTIESGMGLALILIIEKPYQLLYMNALIATQKKLYL